jgi:hypothetical protein
MNKLYILTAGIVLLISAGIGTAVDLPTGINVSLASVGTVLSLVGLR